MASGMSKEELPVLSVARMYGWVLSFLRPYRLQFALFMLFGFAITITGLAIPKVIQFLVDDVFPNKDYSRLRWLMVAFIPLVGCSLGAMVVRNSLQRHIQEYVLLDLRLAMFKQLRRLGFSYFDKNSVGETIALFQADTESFQNIYQQYLPQFVNKTVFLALSLTFFLLLSVKLSLLLIPCFLSYFLIGPFFEKKKTANVREAQKQRRNFTKVVYDSISALLETRANDAEAWDMERVIKQKEIWRTFAMRGELFVLMRGTARHLIVNIGALCLFGYGMTLVAGNEIQVGEFIAFLTYYFQIVYSTTDLLAILTEQRVMVVKSEKLYDFFHLSPAVKESEDCISVAAIQGEIEFRGVSFAYDDRLPVLTKFDLQITKGERVALVGVSGGGKSTVTKLVGRFYEPSEGEIFLDGIPLKQLSIECLRGVMGFVFQETVLFAQSVKENIRFGRLEATDEEIVEAAKLAYAHEFIVKLPHGYDTRVGERGAKLSGGQKQRIAIARMIIKNPRIILLDEATSALDNVSEIEVQKALDTLLRGRTTLAVTHRLSTVQQYDRIVVMENGWIAESGTYIDLMARRGKLYRLVEGRHAKDGELEMELG